MGNQMRHSEPDVQAYRQEQYRKACEDMGYHMMYCGLAGVLWLAEAFMDLWTIAQAGESSEAGAASNTCCVCGKTLTSYHAMLELGHPTAVMHTTCRQDYGKDKPDEN
jgi:hypothetical protein